ncbi:MAG: response regulator [Candidatus Nitrosocosmicus sp.]
MPSPSTFAIMVVDDEEELASLFKTFLERSGYESISFTDPLLALEHFSKNHNKYHLVITDLRMPELNGIELANKIRGNSKTVKILLITAFVVDDVLQSDKFKQAQIVRTIQKPFSLKDLGPKISEILSS